MELYDRVSEAPDAIPRLRQFVLDLAVHGKLVEQDPNDEPAFELIQSVTRNRGSRKHPRQLDITNLDPVKGGPFRLPSSWLWSDIQTLCFVEMGQSPPSEHYNQIEEGLPFFQGKADFGNRYPEPRYWCTKPNKLAFPGDILISVRAPVGPTNVANQECCIGRGLAALRPYYGVYSEYVLTVLRTLEQSLAALGFGTTFVAINKKQLMSFTVPLPPFEEQHRIVAKVAELMALCDSLEAEREKREATRDRLTTASLSRLTAPDVNEMQFKANADFAIRVLSELTTRPDQIKVLRQTILDLAVRGKLVEQDPNDEPAIITLEKARIAKGRLMEARGIRRDADLDLSKSDGEPCSPGRWVWAHLGDFALVQGGKRLPSGASFSPEKTGNIYIRVSDMKGGTIAIEGLRHISEEVREKISKYTIDKEDVFITIAGTIGEVGVIPKELDGQNLTENAAKIVFRGIDQKFLVMVLGSTDVQAQITQKTKQMAQPKLALKRISGLRLPVPPLSEQRRIVERVDFFMNLFGELIQHLEIEVARRGQLLEQMIRMPLQLDAHF